MSISLSPFEKLRKGINLAEKIARIGYGQSGGSVLVQRRCDVILSQSTRLALEEIQLKDPVIRMGFEIAREAASTMQTEHGCGSGTSILFLKSLMDFYSKYGRFPHSDLCPTVEIASWDDLLKMGNPLYVELMKEIGDYGTILVKEGKKVGVEIIKPCAVKVPLFIAERSQNENGGFNLDGPLIAVVDYPLTKSADVAPLMECASQWFPHPFLIVAPFIAGEAIDTIRLNRVKDVGPFYALASKTLHADKSPALEDLAAVSGARIIRRDFPLSMVDGDWFGYLRRIEAGRDSSLLYIAEDKEHLIDEHIARLEHQKNTGFTWDRDSIGARIAALDGGMVELHVCSATPSDTKWEMAKVDEEISVLRSASQNGVVRNVGLWLSSQDSEWKDCCKWWDLVPIDAIDPAAMWTESLAIAKSAVEMIMSTEVAICRTNR